METSGPAIELRGLVKEYRPGLLRKPVRALRGLDLSVPDGEIYALIGPNGAGKTTTFRILLGLCAADAGTGALLGRPLGDRAARRDLGFLPEGPSYYPHLTVEELIALGLRLSGRPADRRRLGEILERFDLAPLAGRSIRRLSKGQLQRVGIAQADAHDPRLLILDEPMSGLDPLSRARIKEWILEARGRGRTVLLASHVLADVEALADRVGILREGRLIAEDSAEQLLAGTEQEVEIEFAYAGDPAPLLEGLDASVEPRAGIWAARLATGRELYVSTTLSRILARGGTIRSVNRRRLSLEGYYVRSVAAAKAGGIGEGTG